VDVRESFDHREFRTQFSRERVRRVTLHGQTVALALTLSSQAPRNLEFDGAFSA